MDNLLNFVSKYFYRENPISPTRIASEHTGFTNIELLNKAVDKLGYRKETNKGLLLNYSPTSIDLTAFSSVQDANSVKIVYSNYITNTYKYDVENKVYKRYVNNYEQIDKNTEQNLTVKNIIVYKVKYSNIQGDNKGRQTIDNVGNGTGYYISNGYAVPITWKKDSRSSATIYKYNNGKEIQVNDGNTFIQIMPDNQTVAIS